MVSWRQKRRQASVLYAIFASNSAQRNFISKNRLLSTDIPIRSYDCDLTSCQWNVRQIDQIAEHRYRGTETCYRIYEDRSTPQEAQNWALGYQHIWKPSQDPGREDYEGRQEGTEWGNDGYMPRTYGSGLLEGPLSRIWREGFGICEHCRLYGRAFSGFEPKGIRNRRISTS